MNKQAILVVSLIVVAAVAFMFGKSSGLKLQNEALPPKSSDQILSPPLVRDASSELEVESFAIDRSPTTPEQVLSYRQETLSYIDESIDSMAQFAHQRSTELANTIELPESIRSQFTGVIQDKMAGDAEIYLELTRYLEKPGAQELIYARDSEQLEGENVESDLLAARDDLMENLIPRIERNRKNYENELRNLLNEDQINAYIDRGARELAEYRKESNQQIIETLYAVVPDMSGDQKSNLNRLLDESLHVSQEEFLIGSTIEFDEFNKGAIKAIYITDHHILASQAITDTLTDQQLAVYDNYFFSRALD